MGIIFGLSLFFKQNCSYTQIVQRVIKRNNAELRVPYINPPSHKIRHMVFT
jgi:hypothetical protein